MSTTITTAAPLITETLPSTLTVKEESTRNKFPTPPKYSGALDKYEKFDVTRVVGTEFKQGIQLAELLKAPNSDDLIRDLAILVAQRGVVFLRAQEITLQEQKELTQKLGALSGKPDSSGLHTHPLTREVIHSLVLFRYHLLLIKFCSSLNLAMKSLSLAPKERRVLTADSAHPTRMKDPALPARDGIWKSLSKRFQVTVCNRIPQITAGH